MWSDTSARAARSVPAAADTRINLPWLQTTTFGTFAVRTRGDLSSVLPAIRGTIGDTDPQSKCGTRRRWMIGSRDRCDWTV
jgi:hypothetical protein